MQNVESPAMKRQWQSLRSKWRGLSFYEKFEEAVVLVLTAIIALVILSAIWNLLVKVFTSLIVTGNFDPTEYAVFQSVFGMILTVIIALEFKRSILVVRERRFGIVQARAVILIGMLAVVRKLIVFNVAETSAEQLWAIAAAILSLGIVYWLVRDQDRKERASERGGLVEMEAGGKSV